MLGAMTAPHQPGIRRNRRLTAIATGAVAAGALTYVGVADPHRPGFLFPPCPFHTMTGWFCPGCGGIRMTHDVLNLDIAAAVRDNVFLLVGLPLLLAWIVVRWRSGRRPIAGVVYVVVVIAAVAWTVVRNMSWFPLVPAFGA